MRYALELTGTSPLLMHGIRLADEDDEFVIEIKKLTSKRAGTKTKQDRDEISRLEWHGSLYSEDHVVVMPTANVKRCLSSIATIRSKGKSMDRALLLLDGVHVPLVHDGPKSIDDLYANPVYRLRKAVGVGKNRVMRIRPHFPVWGLTLSVELLESVMDPAMFIDFVHLAGRAEGLGDGRRIGYGRFTAVVKPA